jgi:hydrogenase expression/formation protein HypE
MAAVTGALYASGAEIHVMRDVTRGGLATVLNEIAASSGALIELDEAVFPVSDEVRAFCGIMGLDPIYMGNEGKMIAVVDGAGAEKALAAVRRTELGRDARIIGRVAAAAPPAATATASAPATGVVMKTRIGGTRRVPVLQGEGLPRIC